MELFVLFRVDAHATTGSSSSMQILHIPRDFTPKQGTQLTEGLFIGKPIAAGLQVSADVHISSSEGLVCFQRQVLLSMTVFLRL